MVIYLPRSKGDRQNLGERYHTPALSSLCPVSAYTDWLHISRITEGPVFRKINRWGKMHDKGLQAGSISSLLKGVLLMSNIEGAEDFSSHSLRRGFASWATANEWDLKSLMEYVGWKDIKSAMRYIDTDTTHARMLIERGLK